MAMCASSEQHRIWNTRWTTFVRNSSSVSTPRRGPASEFGVCERLRSPPDWRAKSCRDLHEDPDSQRHQDLQLGCAEVVCSSNPLCSYGCLDLPRTVSAVPQPRNDSGCRLGLCGVPFGIAVGCIRRDHMADPAQSSATAYPKPGRDD